MLHNFDKAFELMMELEGGYTLHKNPTESTETYSGIYRRYHNSWEGWDYIDQGKTPPKQLVKSFYRTEFWDRIKGDELAGGIDTVVFDFAVNSAPSDAIKALQEAIGFSGKDVDGIIGSGTLARHDVMVSDFHLSRCAEVIEEVSALRLTHMMKSNKKDLKAYGKGWSRRVCKVMARSLRNISPF